MLCNHDLSLNNAAKTFYLNSSFSQAWRYYIQLSTYNQFSICLHCGRVIFSNYSLQEHFAKSNHTMYIFIHNLSIYCACCGKYFQCPLNLQTALLLALPISPIRDTFKQGYPNLGNSCYSSSVLIALAHCRPLLLATSISTNPFCRAFAAASSLSRTFNSLIHAILPQFSPIQQVDACEFLTCLLSKFAEDPRVASIFTGRKRTVRYGKCGHTTTTSEEFTVYSLPFDKDGWDNFSNIKIPIEGSSGFAKDFGKILDWKGEKPVFSSQVSTFFHHGSSTPYKLEHCIEATCLPDKAICKKCQHQGMVISALENIPEVLIFQVQRFGRR